MSGVAPGMRAKTDPQVGRGGGGAKEVSPGKVPAPAPAARTTQTLPLQVTVHRAGAGVGGPDLPVVAGAEGGALPDPDEPVTQQHLFETPVGRVLREVNTSKQWSTLTGVLTKVNKRLPAEQQVDARTFARLLTSVPAAELARNGVWTTTFGAKYMPIVIINRAYAWRVAQGGEQGRCSCGEGGRSGSGSSRFFGSQDYNAGRHALEASAHNAGCLCWTPPTAGHLHSWRRGFD
ncbi:unnamed protein product [Ectocarpus sp. 12 AP-2014]